MNKPADLLDLSDSETALQILERQAAKTKNKAHDLFE
jgi:hypothetical protein